MTQSYSLPLSLHYFVCQAICFYFYTVLPNHVPIFPIRLNDRYISEVICNPLSLLVGLFDLLITNNPLSLLPPLIKRVSIISSDIRNTLTWELSSNIETVSFTTYIYLLLFTHKKFINYIIFYLFSLKCWCYRRCKQLLLLQTVWLCDKIMKAIIVRKQLKTPKSID